MYSSTYQLHMPLTGLAVLGIDAPTHALNVLKQKYLV